MFFGDVILDLRENVNSTMGKAVQKIEKYFWGNVNIEWRSGKVCITIHHIPHRQLSPISNTLAEVVVFLQVIGLGNRFNISYNFV